MHHIEKGVSKTLEKILSDIMNLKGKRVNLHFKSSEKKKVMRSFTSSPRIYIKLAKKFILLDS